MELKKICVYITEGHRLMEKFTRPLHHLVLVKEPSQPKSLSCWVRFQDMIYIIL